MTLTPPWSALLFCLALLSAGCAQEIKIHDDEACADAGKFGGRCFKILSGTKRVIPADVWNLMPAPGVVPGPDSRWARISFTPTGYANLSGALLKLCQVTDECTQEQIKTVYKARQNAVTLSQQLETYKQGQAKAR